MPSTETYVPPKPPAIVRSPFVSMISTDTVEPDVAIGVRIRRLGKNRESVIRPNVFKVALFRRKNPLSWMPVAVRRAIGFSDPVPTLQPFLLGWNTSSQGLGATGSTHSKRVFERTNMPRPAAEGTANVPAGTLLGSGSWFSFWTDSRPAVYCLYRV